ncbi:hypothetical protein DJ535_13840 [Citrobacter murliniae]|uniref:Uncharacterized protein n=1 Tax=Citrobacter murliniae TaxID=67829 RepID=A0ABY2PSX5_9ENTR|nr:hypothetical protein DJ535_13840 [Citrobacter murliniae]
MAFGCDDTRCRTNNLAVMSLFMMTVQEGQRGALSTIIEQVTGDHPCLLTMQMQEVTSETYFLRR